MQWIYHGQGGEEEKSPLLWLSSCIKVGTGWSVLWGSEEPTWRARTAARGSERKIRVVNVKGTETRPESNRELRRSLYLGSPVRNHLKTVLFVQIEKIFQSITWDHPDLWRENVAVTRETRTAREKRGSKEAKASTAMKSWWTVSLMTLTRPMRRRGMEQVMQRTRRHWVTRISSLVEKMGNGSREWSKVGKCSSSTEYCLFS